MTKTRKILEDVAIFAILALTAFIIVFASCNKEEETTKQNYTEIKKSNSVSEFALGAQISTIHNIVPCDTIVPVAMGAQLKVVPNTVLSGVASKGKFKGKKVWRAELCSDQFLDAFSFINLCTQHRIVIADTAEITESSLFYVSRIKN